LVELNFEYLQSIWKGLSRFSEVTIYLMPVQEEQGEGNQSE